MNETSLSRPNLTRRGVRLSCATLLLATLCAGTPARAVAPPAGDPAAPAAGVARAPTIDLNDPQRIAAGRKRFNRTCAGYCHGFEGSGGRAPDFKGRTDLSAEFAFETIWNGREGADVMPPWGGALSEEQIWELVAYLRFLGRQPAD